ncbi:MAG: LacI family transcriptional regulator [Prevotellaceae bacterium]|jgi:LacI family transcriptional regulator|nr:LacI family transcriptional regulator [Prevotellaceae bacterium]
MKTQHVTIKNIAAELGLSVSTVSRALKDHPDISQTTKQRTQALAKQLCYTPNPIALSLKSQRSYLVGVIVPEIAHYFFSTVIGGIESVADACGYSLILVQSGEQLSREEKVLGHIVNLRVDGVLASVSKETNSYGHFQRLLDERIPLVFFDRVADSLDATHVTVDDFRGAYDATKHLIAQGCRSVAHFYGPRNRSIFRSRHDGYRQALEDAGLPFRPQLVVEADTLEKGTAQTERLVQQRIAFDAIFAVNDFTAAGAMLALRKAKLSVPHDVAVVGYTDAPTAKVLTPSLSSVHQSGFEMGQQAMKALLRQIGAEDRLPAERIVLPAQLVVRESSLRDLVTIK